MTPYKQRIKHDPDNDIWGDCWRTAWGSLLDIDPMTIPHFADGGTSEEAHKRIDEWLVEQGFCRIVVGYQAGKLNDVLATIENCTPGVFYILAGTSKTGCNHVVICVGNEIVHDPSPDDVGIVGPCDDGLYWVEFLGSRQAVVS